MSDFLIAKVSTSWIPSYSSPIKSGLNNSSGALKRAGPIYESKEHVQNITTNEQIYWGIFPDLLGFSFHQLFTSSELPSGNVYEDFSVSIVSSFWGLLDK